jgi:hypothetical protein
MRTYYYSDNGVQNGPVTLDELKSKNIKPDTLIWYEGISEWTSANKITELQNLFVGKSTPPPLLSTINTTQQIETKSNNDKQKFDTYLYLIGIGIVGILIHLFLLPYQLLTYFLGTMLISIGSFGYLLKIKLKNKNHAVISVLAGGFIGFVFGFYTQDFFGWIYNYQNNNTEQSSENLITQAEAQKILDNQANIEAERVKEAERQKRREFLTSQINLRNRCTDYIIVEPNYSSSILGGLSDVSVTVTNNLGYTINEISLTVNYNKTLGGTANTETITIKNIKNGASKTAKCPNSSRGTSVTAQIFTMKAKDIGLCYTLMIGMRGESLDPYLCAADK